MFHSRFRVKPLKIYEITDADGEKEQVLLGMNGYRQKDRKEK